MNCKYCGKPIKEAEWYNLLPFFPVVGLSWVLNGRVAPYRHSEKLFTNCRAFLIFPKKGDLK